MFLQIHYGVNQGRHLKAVRAIDAALGYIAVLNVGSARSTGGQNITCIPALDAAMQGYQSGRAVGHIVNDVLGVHFAVEHRLKISSEISGSEKDTVFSLEMRKNTVSLL